MMNPGFETAYDSILQQVERINPVRYAATRNYTDGAVTRLSPYISRGVLSLNQVASIILKRYDKYQSEKLLQELAWREYWQRVWENKGDEIFTDLKQPQPGVMHHGMVRSVADAQTGIDEIDRHIRLLYSNGYMHNHVRMYIASIVCNIAGAHWKAPSSWLYYHLLDGDIASNALSWQWVAGSFSTKKYYCNQDNINKYTKTNQAGTFLDKPYELLPGMSLPGCLSEQTALSLKTMLPENKPCISSKPEKIFIYNSYNLDPSWHQGEKGKRVLLLEPEHFSRFPVSHAVLDFILALAGNIPDIEIFTGSFTEIKHMYPEAAIHFKKHPAFTHYRGTAESPGYLFPSVNGYYPSFMSYWKKCEKASCF